MKIIFCTIKLIGYKCYQTLLQNENSYSRDLINSESVCSNLTTLNFVGYSHYGECGDLGGDRFLEKLG